MEKEHITTKSALRCASKKALCTLPLAVPIIGIIHYSGKILAQTELGDPVQLYTDAPLPMSMVHTCLIMALLFIFTPFKRISGIAIGLALGGLCFYGLDQYEQLKDISEMGLSSMPLMEMISITNDGRNFLVSMAACIGTQILYGIADPIILRYRRKKTSDKKMLEALND